MADMPAADASADASGAPFFPNSAIGVLIALACATIATVVAVWRIRGHLLVFTVPRLQKPIVRILFIVPFYAVFSWLSLSAPNAAPYFEAIRDIYEAFAIYSFLSLVLEYCGGENACVVHIMRNPGSVSHIFPLNLCLKRAQCDATFVRTCKQAALQFVFIKPPMALAAIIMAGKGEEDQKAWVVSELLIYNISYTVALYGLLMFYIATKEHPGLKSRKPIYKFASVKLVVFATYYQSLVFRLVTSDATKRNALNAFVICLEMPIFAILHAFAFPASEYESQEEGVGDDVEMPPAVAQSRTREVLNVQDVASDAVRSFNPKYSTHLRLGEDDAGFTELDAAADEVEEEEEVEVIGNPFALHQP